MKRSLSLSTSPHSVRLGIVCVCIVCKIISPPFVLSLIPICSYTSFIFVFIFLSVSSFHIQLTPPLPIIFHLPPFTTPPSFAPPQLFFPFLRHAIYPRFIFNGPPILAYHHYLAQGLSLVPYICAYSTFSSCTHVTDRYSQLPLTNPRTGPYTFTNRAVLPFNFIFYLKRLTYRLLRILPMNTI